jgi:hypothetical protein
MEQFATEAAPFFVKLTGSQIDFFVQRLLFYLAIFELFNFLILFIYADIQF